MTENYRLINKWVLIGALVTAIVILLYGALFLTGKSYSNFSQNTPLAQVTVLAAGEIPTPDIRLLEITPTPTAGAVETSKGITVGDYVKIEGTSGSGLRIRSGPGLSTDTVFVANESDVYIVIEGPSEIDGLLWWKVKTPYDENRQGWAAADYLTRIISE